MNRTVTARRPFAPVLMFASALALLVASVTPGLHPAAADQFTPLEDPPSIDVVSSKIFTLDTGVAASLNSSDYSALNGTPIQPAFPQSKTVYNIFLDLETNGSLDNVTEIRLCLYDSTDANFDTEAKIAAVCGIDKDDVGTGPLSDAPDAWTNATAAGTANFTPEKVFVIRYLVEEGGVDTPGFRVEKGGGSVNYEDDGSTFVPDGAQKATARFSFTVSNAMQVSSGWQIRAAAESVSDTDTRFTKGQSAQDLPTATFAVAYFGHMSNTVDEVRPSVDFDLGVPNTTVLEDKLLTGHYTANDASSLTIRGTDFEYVDGATTHTIALADNGDFSVDNSNRRAEDRNNTGTALGTALTAEAAVLNVPDEQVSLDCAFVAEGTTSNDAAAFVQVTTTSKIFATSGITATGEALRDGLSDHTCALSYRGAAPVANKVYKNTVFMGLVQGTSAGVGSAAGTPNFQAGD